MKKTTFTLLVSLCCAASVVQARDIYVAPSGNDAGGAGTVGSPYATVQKAVSVAVAGDVVHLRAGTYGGNITVNKPNLTIRSYAGERAVISSSATNSSVQQTIWFTATRGKLLDLELVGGYYYAVKFETGSAVVKGCKIHDSGRDCIKIVPGADDVTIQQCEIYNSGQRDPSNAEGIDNVNADRMLVQDCYIHDIATYGLYPKGGAIGCVIERCLVTNCGSGGIMLGGYTDDEFFDPVQNPGWYENIDGTVRNCIVVNTQGGGVALYAALRPRVYNNTLVNVAASSHAGIVSDFSVPRGGQPFHYQPDSHQQHCDTAGQQLTPDYRLPQWRAGHHYGQQQPLPRRGRGRRVSGQRGELHPGGLENPPCRRCGQHRGRPRLDGNLSLSQW